MSRPNENHPAARQLQNAEALATRLFEDIVEPGRFTASVGIGKDQFGLYIGIRCAPDTPSDVLEGLSRRSNDLRTKIQPIGCVPVFANLVPPRAGMLTGTLPAEQLRMKPLHCGAEISILNTKSPGSLGCFVTHQQSKHDGFVSCSHVLHPAMLDHEGRSVTQPVSSNPVARVVGAAGRHIALKGLPRGQRPTPADMNVADIGFARVSDNSEIPSHPRRYDSSHGALDFTGVDDAAPGEEVFKVGRSGLSWGAVDQVFVHTPVGVDPHGPNPLLYWFNTVFTIRSSDQRPFSQQGDSGAIVVRKSDHNALGMIFAVTPTLAYAFPLEAGLTEADCRLL